MSDKKQNIILGISRPSYYDPWDAESYFKTVLSCLHTHALKNLYILDLKNNRTCKMQGNKQLHITAYLADLYECEITICQNSVKLPESREIPNISR